MKTLQELSDELGCYAVEEHYEPNDMIQLLTFMSHIVEHLQRLERLTKQDKPSA